MERRRRVYPFVEPHGQCTTVTSGPQCRHENGWYVSVPFWVFSRRIYVCCDCGAYLHGRRLKEFLAKEKRQERKQ